VGESGLAVYLDFKDAIHRLGADVIKEKYGNLFHMYQKITDVDPYQAPMSIYPAIHYTMGGLWVDYNLESTIPGLFVLGEANFSDHGANRLGASALMQGLADGYFVVPYTLGSHIAGRTLPKVTTEHPAFAESAESVRQMTETMLSIQGSRSVDSIHRELGHIMWDYCGMARTAEGLDKARSLVRALRDEFWQNVRVTGKGADLNKVLEHAGRVADFLEFAELMIVDARRREESCGGHFREEFQTEEGEALRNDEEFSYVAAWEFAGVGNEPILHKEPLVFEEVKPATRSYK
jgi:succinate dehydrogenase / fumarate reductase flavoprotein subunit